MGAGRGRVLRQMLTESLLLAAMGGSGGLLLGYLGRNVLPRLLVQWLGRRIKFEIHFDWGVFCFAAAVTLLTGLLFGLAPAWSAARTRSEQQPERECADGDAAAQGAGRQGAGGLSDCAFNAAGDRRRAVSADAGRLELGGCRIPHGSSAFGGDRSAGALRYPGGKDVALHQRLEQAFAAVPGVEGGNGEWTCLPRRQHRRSWTS